MKGITTFRKGCTCTPSSRRRRKKRLRSRLAASSYWTLTSTPSRTFSTNTSSMARPTESSSILKNSKCIWSRAARMSSSRSESMVPNSVYTLTALPGMGQALLVVLRRLTRSASLSSYSGGGRVSASESVCDLSRARSASDMSLRCLLSMPKKKYSTSPITGRNTRTIIHARVLTGCRFCVITRVTVLATTRASSMSSHTGMDYHFLGSILP